jgi:hypothetical protein
MASLPGSVIDFHYTTPVGGEALRENVRASLASRLRDVVCRPVSGRTLHIIASGPSATSAPFDATDTMALNGASALFRQKGREPTFWAAVDPQPFVADFIPAPAFVYTTHLINSQCDTDVRVALGRRDAVLWHTYDPRTADLLGGRTVVSAGTSVTLNAIPLAHMLGYRNIEIWGWDGCFVGSRHHAVDQDHDTSDEVSVCAGGWRRPFRSTATWAFEAQQAVSLLSQVDYRVVVRGRGMIAHILRKAGVRPRATT